MKQILESLMAAIDADRPAVFSVLVETRGSTPQKPGAAMLIFPDGSQIGTLGGGCVEAEVKRRALARLADGGPELLTFELDHDYGWDDGLICGGRMTMLIDPVRPGVDLRYYDAARRALSSGAGCTEAVVVDAERAGAIAGARWLFGADGTVLAATDGTETDGRAAAPPAALLRGLRPLSARPRAYVAEGTAFLPTLPRCRLIIVGAGHVGKKTAELAADVDFDVWIVDDREDYCSAERFPHAERRLVGPVDELLKDLETRADDFAIIVTRGHSHDEEALFHLAPRTLRYLGMIGSRRKIRMIFDDLERLGISRRLLERVHAPLGYDIGSQTVPEIAVSIVAELIAHRNLAEAPSPVYSLRDRSLARRAPSESNDPGDPRGAGAGCGAG